MRTVVGFHLKPSAVVFTMNCPHCGRPPRFEVSDSTVSKPPPVPWFFGLEFRSKVEFFSIPLLHVATGFNPHTGLPRLARGIIAIGNFAVGVVAIGGIACGGFAISGIGVGVVVIAGVALGWAAIGGLAVGLVFALGGLAVSSGYAFGGLPLIINLIGVDPYEA